MSNGSAKKVFSKFKKSKRPKKPNLVNAISDWKKILLITPILLAGIIALNFYFFYIMRSEDIFLVTPELSGSVLEIVDREMLKETIDYFEAERLRLEQLKLEEPSSVDPAL